MVENIVGKGENVCNQYFQKASVSNSLLPRNCYLLKEYQPEVANAGFNNE